MGFMRRRWLAMAGPKELIERVRSGFLHMHDSLKRNMIWTNRDERKDEHVHGMEMMKQGKQDIGWKSRCVLQKKFKKSTHIHTNKNKYEAMSKSRLKKNYKGGLFTL